MAAGTYADRFRQLMQEQPIPGAPLTQLGGSSDQLMTVPSGGPRPVNDPRYEAAQRIAATVLANRLRAMRPNIDYSGGGGGVTANDILGQRGPVVISPQYQQPVPDAQGAVPVTPEQAAAGMHPGLIGMDRPTVPGQLPAAYVSPPYNVSGAPGENRTGLPKYQPSTYGEPYGPTEGDPTGQEAPHGTLGHDIMGSLNKAAEVMVGNTLGRAPDLPVIGPAIEKGLELSQRPFNANMKNVGDSIYAKANGGNSSDLGGVNLNPTYYIAETWATDPENKDKINAVYENGLDLNGDGTPDVSGGQAVMMVYFAEEHPGFIDQMIAQMAFDPLFYLGAVAPAASAGREGAQVAEEMAIIANLPRAARILRAADRALSGVTTAGEYGNKVADLPFTLPAWMVRKAATIPGVRKFAKPATWLFEPAPKTAEDIARTGASDIGESVVNATGGPPDIYPPTPGVVNAQAPEQYRGTGSVTVNRPIDTSTGAPVGTFITDQPIPPSRPGTTPPGGGVSVVEGPIRPRPRGPEGNGTAPPVVENVVPTEHPDVTTTKVPGKNGTGTYVIGDNGEVQVLERAGGVWEVQVKQNGKWVGQKGFSGEGAEREAVNYGKGIVTGDNPILPPTERVTTVKPKTKKQPTEPVTEPIVPEPVVVRATPDDVAPVSEKPGSSGWSLSSKNHPEGMIAQVERDFPEQWARVKRDMAYHAEDFEQEMNRSLPSLETNLRPRKNSDAGYADQKIIKAEFFAELLDEMRNQGIPVDQLRNEPGISRNPVEQWVGDAIYGDEVTARGARKNLISKGYAISPEKLAAELPAKVENIRNATLPKPKGKLAKDYPNGSISYEREVGGPVKNMGNDALAKMTQSERDAIAADVARDYQVRAERYQRIQGVRDRFHPPGTQPGGGVALQDMLAGTVQAYDQGLSNLTDIANPLLHGEHIAPAFPEAAIAHHPSDPAFKSYESDQVNRFVKWGDLGEEQANYLKSVVGEGDRTAWDILADTVDKHMQNVPDDPAFWAPNSRAAAQWRRGVGDEFAATIKEITGKPVPQKMSRSMINKTVDGIYHSVGLINRMARENMIYNIFTGPRGWAQDIISTSTKVIWEGHTGAAFGALFDWIPVMRNQIDGLDNFAGRIGMDVHNELHIPGKFDAAAEADRTALNEAISGIFRFKEGSTADKITGWLTAPASSRFVAKGRAASDNAMRRAVYLDTAEGLLPSATREWRRMVRKWSEERGILQETTNAYLYELGDQFTPAQALDTLRELGYDAGLSRAAMDEFASLGAQQWRKSVNTIRNKAFDETKRVLFSYEKTNLDAFMGKFIFFHYWMSRAIPSYFKLALHNPELAAMWIRAWNDVADRAEAQGQPKSLVGYLRFFGNSSTGWAHSYNPIQFFIPFDALRMDPYANTTYEQLTQFMAVSPVLQGVAAAAGWSNRAPDMLGLYATRNATMTFVNELRAHGIIGNVSLADDWYEQATLNAFQYANGLVDHLPYTNDVHFRSRNDYNTETIDYMMRTQIEQTTGVPYDANNPLWMPGGTYFELWADAKRDFASGNDNPIATQAYKDWAHEEAQRLGLSFIMPGGIRSTYGPRDAALTAAKEGDAGEKTFKKFAQEGSQESFKLDDLNAQLNQLGTQTGRDAYRLWNEIALSDTINDNDVLTIGGESFRGWQIKGMTHDQRVELANRWLDQYDGAHNEMDNYKVQRETFLNKYPEIGDVKEYASMVRKYEGGPHAYRLDRAKNNPNFAREMEAQREYLLSQGTDPSVVEKELDEWVVTIDGYKAINGIRGSTYENQPISTGDQGAVDTIVRSLGGSSDGGGSSGGTKAEPKTPAAKTKDKVNTYLEKLDLAIAGMKAAGMNVTEQDIVFGNPLYDQVYGSYGVPDMPMEVNLYYQWKLMQPAGADTSVDAWIKVLEELGYQKAA